MFCFAVRWYSGSSGEAEKQGKPKEFKFVIRKIPCEFCSSRELFIQRQRCGLGRWQASSGTSWCGAARRLLVALPEVPIPTAWLAAGACPGGRPGQSVSTAAPNPPPGWCGAGVAEQRGHVPLAHGAERQ